MATAGVELVVLFTDKLQAGAYFQMFECFATFPIAEACNVEIVQMNFL